MRNSYKMAKSSKPNRKKVLLTIDDKIDILQLLNFGTLYTIISEKYGIGRSTVADIIKSALKLEAFKNSEDDGGYGL